MGLCVAALGAVTLAGCAAKAPPPAPVVTPPVVQAIPPRPTPPNSAARTLALPPRAADGTFMTPNARVAGSRAFWQVRIALNVAAIGCRGSEEATMIAGYNNFVKLYAAPIRNTERSVISELATATGTNGVAARDKLSTELFNYFAQPPAQRKFCAVATDMVGRVNATPAAQAITMAPAWLAELDQPFSDFYTAYATWQTDAAAWDRTYGPMVPPNNAQPQPAPQPPRR